MCSNLHFQGQYSARMRVPVHFARNARMMHLFHIKFHVGSERLVRPVRFGILGFSYAHLIANKLSPLRTRDRGGQDNKGVLRCNFRRKVNRTLAYFSNFCREETKKMLWTDHDLLIQRSTREIDSAKLSRQSLANDGGSDNHESRRDGGEGLSDSNESERGFQ